MIQAITVTQTSEGKSTMLYGPDVLFDKQDSAFKAYKPSPGVVRIAMAVTGREVWKVRTFSETSSPQKTK